MKKQIVIPLCCVLSAAVIGGSIYGVIKFNDSKTIIDVLPVSMLSTTYWNSTSSSGYVTSNVSQQIYLEEKQVIEKIYVHEGDKVSIGDKLVAFDTTLSELDLEDKRISLQKIDLQIKDINKQIQQIKENKTPVDVGTTQNTFGSNENPVKAPESSDTAPANIVVTENPEKDSSSESASTDTGSQETSQPQAEPEKQLDFNTEATPIENAYEILCDENTIITPEFINRIRGCAEGSTEADPAKAITVILKIADSGSGLTLNGRELKLPTDDEIPTRLGKFIRNNRRMDNYPEKLDKNTDILNIDGKDVVYCKPETIITPEFIKRLLAVSPTENSEGQEAKAVTLHIKGQPDFILDGSKLSAPDESKIKETTVKYFTENNDFEMKPEEPDTETADSGDIDVDDPIGGGDIGDDFPIGGGDIGGDIGGDFPIGGGDIGGGPVYTQEEIKQLVTQKEQEIAKLNTERKQAELDMTKLQKQIDAAVVTSSVNGIVKTAIDPSEENSGLESGSPFIVVQSEEGLYLTGTIDELQLETIKVGQTITANSYMSGGMFNAEITEISNYPTDYNMSYSENSNVSYYPFKAYIENADGLTNGEYVDLMMDTALNSGEDDALYILKAYIRQDDDGTSYVYVRDENERLKKQTVVTGKNIYNSYTEIKSGLTMDDYIAFPYGKNLKDGVKTQEGSSDNIIY